jgi:hypothetical protein
MKAAVLGVLAGVLVGCAPVRDDDRIELTYYYLRF